MATGSLALNLSRSDRLVAKRALALLLDSRFCVLTIWLAYCFSLNEWTVLTGIQWLPVFVSLCMALPILIVMGM
ncbi:hypothetical protein ACC739_37910, partial [Rhizobium ruizarguesonis]